MKFLLKKDHLIPAVLIAIMAVGIGGIIPTVTRTITQLDVRVVFSVLTIIAATLILLQIKQWGVYGFFSPLTWTLLGFINFHFLTPITHPDYFYLYSIPSLYFSIVNIVFAGMACFAIGFYLIPKISWRFIYNWVETPLSRKKIFFLVNISWLVYLLLLIYVAHSGEMSFIEYLTTNSYLFGKKEFLPDRFDGLGYYIYLLIRIIPIGLASPTMYCITARYYRKSSLLFITSLYFVSIVYSINSGIRSVLLYTLGGALFYLVILEIKSKSFLTKRNLKSLFVVLSVIVFSFLLATFQFYFRYYQTNSRDISLFDILALTQTTRLDSYYQTTDQNFTLYRVVKAASDGDIDYLWGESYAVTPVAFIPRSLWPSKPGGASMYYKLSKFNPWISHDNVSYSYLGELTYNFSVLAIMPGSLFFGVLAGVWWRVFLKYRGSDIMKIIYSMSIIPFVFMVRGTFHAMFGNFIFALCICVLILKFSKKTNSANGI